MSFEHEGQRVTHARLHAALLRGVRFSDEEGCFLVQIGRFRGAIEVEDVPWWVVSYDADSGLLATTDGACEELDVATLAADADLVLRCRVKGRFAARFTRGAQAELLAQVRAGAAGVEVRVGDRWRLAPALAPD
jgi:hypothetical protein